MALTPEEEAQVRALLARSKAHGGREFITVREAGGRVRHRSTDGTTIIDTLPRPTRRVRRLGQHARRR